MLLLYIIRKSTYACFSYRHIFGILLLSSLGSLFLLLLLLCSEALYAKDELIKNGYRARYGFRKPRSPGSNSRGAKNLANNGALLENITETPADVDISASRLAGIW